MRRRSRGVTLEATLALGLVLGAVLPAQTPAAPQGDGRSDPSFTQPSIAPGVDYTVPTEAEITRALGRIRD